MPARRHDDVEGRAVLLHETQLRHGGAGDLLQITDPMGRVVTATVPEGIREGDTFSLPYVKQVPVAQGVVVARATPANTSQPGASPAAGGEGGG